MPGMFCDPLIDPAQKLVHIEAVERLLTQDQVEQQCQATQREAIPQVQDAGQLEGSLYDSLLTQLIREPYAQGS